MSKKTYATEPFQHNYKIWDVAEDKCVFLSKDIDEVYQIYVTCYHNVPLHTLSYNFFMHSLDGDRRFRYEIRDHFGQFIDARELHRQRYGYRSRPLKEYRGPDVRYKKGNPNKIKRGYYTWGYWWDEDYPKYYEHPFKVYGCYRRIHTLNEIRQNAGTVNDMGQKYVRGKRRGYNIPTNYDDPMNSAHYTAKSWKHHSKRRKQWKPKD